MRIGIINGYTTYRKFKGSINNDKRNSVVNNTTINCQPIEQRLRGIRNVF